MLTDEYFDKRDKLVDKLEEEGVPREFAVQQVIASEDDISKRLAEAKDFGVEMDTIAYEISKIFCKADF